MRTHWVMDLETMTNLFVGVFQDYKTDTTKTFVVHPPTKRNDIKELIKFLNENVKLSEWHVSFNGLSFDSQIIQEILEKQKYFLKCSTEDLVTQLYDISQETIFKSRNKDIIIRGGVNIYPAEIEGYLRTHQDIAGAEAFGV